MGGKSTYMRQLGLIVLMAQIGCFVPAKKAQLPAFSALYTRVGASDNQSRGVSTFMSEMIDMSNILSACGEEGGPSLILIDELGRGTSTYDGLGLSWGILEFILQEIPNCFCLFTTLFYELTTIAKQFPAVKNIHVTALNKETYITMLYGVREGPSDQSFGINVAQLCNFPKEVIRDARKKVWELEAIAKANYATEEERKRVSEEKIEAVQKRIRIMAEEEKVGKEEVKELIKALEEL